MATPAKPIILYKNILEDGTVTVTSEASGFPIENIFDYRAFTLWKPTGSANQNIDIDNGSNVTCDAMGIIGHNLGTQTITLSVQHDDNSGFASPTTVYSASIITDNPLYFNLNASGTDRYWRINIDNQDAACFVGHISLGQKLTMEVLPQDGYDIDSQQTRGESYVSQNGHFLGSAVQWTERRLEAHFRYLTQSWIDSDLLAFLYNHYSQLKPFFYVPDITNYATRVYFLRAPDNPTILLPSQSTYRHWTMQAVGVRQSVFEVA